MSALFKHISQVVTWADYQKLLRRALAGEGGEEAASTGQDFHYFESFPFDQKPGLALLVVGDVSKGLLEELKRLAGKADRAKGTLRQLAGQKLALDVETGRIKARLVAATLKQAGVHLEVLQGDQATEPPTGTGAATQAPQAQPAPAAPQEPQAQEWAATLRLFQPHFNKALNAAQRSQDASWAEELVSHFVQMTGQAQAGDFGAAKETLKRLLLLLQSRAAAQAEGVRPPAAQEASSEEPALEAAESGQDLGFDATAFATPPLSAEDWQQGVTGPLKELQGWLVSRDTDWRKVDAAALRDSLERIRLTVSHADQLLRESGSDKSVKPLRRLIDEWRKTVDDVQPRLWDIKLDRGEGRADEDALLQRIKGTGEIFKLAAEMASLASGPKRVEAIEIRLESAQRDHQRLVQEARDAEAYLDRLQERSAQAYGRQDGLEAAELEWQTLQDDADRQEAIVFALYSAGDQRSEPMDPDKAQALLRVWEAGASALAASVKAGDFAAAVERLESLWPQVNALLDGEGEAQPSMIAGNCLQAMVLLLGALKLAARTAHTSTYNEKAWLLEQTYQMARYDSMFQDHFFKS